MPSFFIQILIILITLECTIHAQVQFYYFDFDGISSWTDETGVIDTGSTNFRCQTTPCWEMEGGSSALTTIDATLYHTMTVYIDAEETNLHNGECCYLSIKTFSATSWTIYSIVCKNGDTSLNYDIPLAANYNGQRLQIRLENNGNSASDLCYWDDLEIWGTKYPTQSPTPAPTSNPTPAPTSNPTPAPSKNPTPSPTKNPTPSPTINPTPSPTSNPTETTFSPTPSPTINPTPTPTTYPTHAPTNNPTPSPTNNPTPAPSSNPTPAPTFEPTSNPISTSAPTSAPTSTPTSFTNNPTITPTVSTATPTLSTIAPTLSIVYNIKTTEENNGGKLANNSEKSSSVGLIVGLLSVVACLCIIFSILIFYIFGKKRKRKRKWSGPKVFDDSVVNIKVSSQTNGSHATTTNNVNQKSVFDRIISVSMDNELSDPYQIPEIEPDGRYVIEMNDMNNTGVSLKIEGPKATIEGDDDNLDYDICDVNPDEVITPRGDDTIITPIASPIAKNENNNNKFKDDDIAMTLGLFVSDKDKNNVVSDMLNNDTEIIGDDEQGTTITGATDDNISGQKTIETETQGFVDDNESFSQDSDDNVLHNDYTTTGGGHHVTAGGPTQFDVVKDNISANDIAKRFEINELPINDDFAKLIDNNDEQNINIENSDDDSDDDSDMEILVGIDTVQ